MSEPVKNEDGWIALKYMRQQRVLVEHTPTKRQYVFDARANIWLSWVHPDDVQHILDLKGGCCGPKKANVFQYAHETDVRQWTKGGGR